MRFLRASWKWILAAFVVLIIIGALSDGGEEGKKSQTSSSAKPSATPSATKTSKPSSEPSPQLSDRAKVQKAVAQAVDGAKVAQDTMGRNYVIEFPVSDNFTNHLIRVGAEMDTKDIVQAVVQTEVPVKSVGVRGTFPLSDQYGNTEKGQVIWTYWGKAPLTRVDWSDDDVVMMLDVSQAADVYGLHPELQGS